MFWWETNTMTVRKQKLKFKKSMTWEKPIEDFIKSRIHGVSINVCCGSSRLGTVLVDIEPQAENVIKADFLNVPYPNNSFDTVISDPVWKLSYYKRMKPFFELIRLCKVGGTIIFNATWIPESKAVKLKEVWVRQSAPFANVSIISVFEKTTDSFDEQKFVSGEESQ